MNINGIIIFLLSLLLLPMELWAGVVSSQSDNDKNSTQFVLKGKLDVKIPFTMRLRNYGKTIEGTAHYENQSSNAARYIKGSVDENNAVTLDEYEGKKRIGTYKGILQSGVFLGIFTNADGETFAFSSKIVDGEMPASGLNSNQFETKTFIFKKDQNDVHVEIKVDYPINGNEDLVVETRLFIRTAIEVSFNIDIAYSNLADGQKLINYVGTKKYSDSENEKYGEEYSPGEFDDIIDINKNFENEKCVSFCARSAYHHGEVWNDFCRGATFRKEDGIIISVIKYPLDSKLLSILKETIKDDLGDRFELVDEKAFEDSQLPIAPPHLSKYGVQFDYQHYEIGPGVLGQVSVVIPYEKIKQYMTDEAKVLIE